MYGFVLRRHCGLMVSALVSGSSGPGTNPGQGHCVLFLGKTLGSYSLLSSPRRINGYRRI